jgi:hypothetical protein
MTNLLDFTKALFGSDQVWSNITREDKEAHYFIINRMFAKKYPEWSCILSQDNIDKSSAMDSWHHLVRGRGYEAWFWKKSPNSLHKKIEQFDDEIMLKHDLSKLELDCIKQLYPESFDVMAKDIKRVKKQEGGKLS